jgi:pimeloyl-ACP methyl ester carboxylesterase
VTGFAKLLLRLAFGTLSLSIAAVLFVAHQVNGAGTRPAIGKERLAGREAQTVAYFDHGSGEPVVLLASLARSVSDFNELADAIAEAGFRTLAVESRGIGGTAGGGPFAAGDLHELAGDVLTVLRDVRLPEGQQVHMVGHAFGNRVARTLATDHPERIRSLTLIAAGGRTPPEPRVGRALVVSSLSFLPWLVREPALRLAFFSGDNEIPGWWRGGWWFWGGIGQAAAADATRSSEFWSGGDSPMLVLQAENDRLAPASSSGDLLAEEFPDRVTLVEIRGAGHALLPEHPDAIRDAVLPFLQAQRSD